MDTFADLLRSKGLRNTTQRRAVLAALKDAPHATAPRLEDELGIARGAPAASAAGLSRQGLYNVLDDLTRAGLVRCIEPAGSPARYELRVGDNHHHLVCRSCGTVEDVDCAVGRAPCIDPGDDRGFAVDEAEITWWGLCVSCQAARESSGA
ncbi:transcriptional repressor [Microtetraspora sp. NBRC 13810]|uniref:Fur family transcriptional regulator n=1 Tax=Microtetraspora sp. NBRC 13810 TaxID=3030990 RepID=UPI0024A4907B|nr:Fur family transcriptional regulator [Microtetraspora sp. NBRC 13810]GLW07215.1 transcriptional repressor [Microtetraspora sp. NBRC 13810]